MYTCNLFYNFEYIIYLIDVDKHYLKFFSQ